MIARTLLCVASLASAVAPSQQASRPAPRDMAAPAPNTIADRGSAVYRFTDIRLPAAPGRLSYRLRVGVPRRAAPRAGHPIVWLLDGKAALAHVDDALLAELDRASPPVIVAVGHDTPLRLDGAARTWDHTPVPDPRSGQGGGADALLARMTGDFADRVDALTTVDRARQTLWGHSLGGLFVLYASMTRPGTFRTGYAADPSLWWADRAILTAAVAATPDRRRLVVAEAGVPPDAARPGRRPVDEADRTAFYRRIEASGIALRHVTLPGLTHGQVLAATVAPALRLAAGVTP